MENPNVLRFTGFADIYDQYRPKPPEIIADLLLQLAGMDRADHVDSDRFVGLMRSQGSIADLLKQGYTEAEVALDRLRETVQLRFGDRTMRWFWCYRIRVGIK